MDSTRDEASEPLMRSSSPLSAPRTRKRPKRSAARCGCLICGTIIGGIVLFFLGSLVYGFYLTIDQARHPHRAEYLKPLSSKAGPRLALVNGSSTLGAADGVLPFIGRDDTFDVYFTVWARVPDDQVLSTLGVTLEELRADMDAERQRLGSSLQLIRKSLHWPDEWILRDAVERCVHSEKILEGMDMRARNVHRDVQFELPLAAFKNELINTIDVRGIVSIVPTSRTKLDRLTEVSDWRPKHAGPMPRMDHATANALGLGDVQKKAIDMIAYSFPMIYLELPANATHGPEPGVDRLGAAADLEDEDEKATGSLEVDDRMAKGQEQYRTCAPYFIGKSHVYIMDETRTFNRTAYDKKHKALQRVACGRMSSHPPHRQLCMNNYKDVGPYGVRLKFAAASSGVERTGDAAEEAADEQIMYGPYVRSTHQDWGPRDLVALPVKRDQVVKEITEESVMVKHHLTFSALSPGRALLLDTAVQPIPMRANVTRDELVKWHDDWEYLSGVIGSKGRDTHPVRRFILGSLRSVVLSMPISILSTLYWYTRVTSTGISTPGTTMQAVSSVVPGIWTVWHAAMDKDIPWWQVCVVAAFTLFDVGLAYLMLRTVSPWELAWRGWVPVVRRSEQSRGERKTRRVEARHSWHYQLLLFGTIYALAYAITHYRVYLIPALHTPPEDDISRVTSGIPPWFFVAQWSMALHALILQLYLNAALRSFAGAYALTAVLVVARHGVEALYYVPSFIGRYDVREGVRALDAAEVVLALVAGWQAVRFRRVEQAEGDEAEE